MLDNLRDDASSSPFFEDDNPSPELNFEAVPPPRVRRGRFLGMTPFQRFIIAVMLMLMVCLVGAMLLLVTGRMGLYF
ncbi:MAG: hypothetical protein ACM3QS_06910 [Bacteroidota bacterium]